jgi:hypothetical protein
MFLMAQNEVAEIPGDRSYKELHREGSTMNNKRRHLIMIFISITICSVVLLTLFLPRPIVKNADSSVIMRISYNPYIGQDVDEWIELDGYDKHAVFMRSHIGWGM